MKTRALGIALATTATLWLAPAATAQTAPATTTAEQTYQRRAFAATNHQRDRHDRARLRHQHCVQKYAVRQARRMARQQRMFHQDLGRVLRACGLRMAGENVAYGYRSGRAVVNDGWMHSAGHRENILNPSYRLLGVGARRGDDGTWYAAQVFGRR
jgi:uncharacterized protein YkwD